MEYVVKEISNEELAVIERELLNSLDMIFLTDDVVFDITDDDMVFHDKTVAKNNFFYSNIQCISTMFANVLKKKKAKNIISLDVNVPDGDTITVLAIPI